MEHFRGQSHTVHLSTGGTYELYRALVALAQRVPDDQEVRAVAAYLMSLLDLERKVACAFDCAPPPAELAAEPRRNALAALLHAFCVELGRPTPNPALCDVVWSRDLRLSWLARMIELRLIVLDGIEVPVAPLALSDHDMLGCELERLQWRLGEQLRQMPGRTISAGVPRATLEAALVLVERICALAEAYSHQDSRRILHDYRSREAELREALGDRKGAAQALRLAACLCDDAELRQVQLELASELERND